MDRSWNDVFYDKLVEAKLITCSIVFKYSKLRELYSRKRNSTLFRCHARCPNSTCPLIVKMKVLKFVSPGQSVVFRVEIIGTPRHEDPLECNQRPTKGVKRARMGKLYY
jgi:hypothetical protein